jgi:hypothetical protein
LHNFALHFEKDGGEYNPRFRAIEQTIKRAWWNW